MDFARGISQFMVSDALEQGHMVLFSLLSNKLLRRRVSGIEAQGADSSSLSCFICNKQG